MLIRLQVCLNGIKTWITANFLLLHSDKTEVVVLVPEYLKIRQSSHLVTLNIASASGSTVKNLGVMFDQGLSVKSHKKQSF